jgi:hypothetical protein
LFVLLLPHLLHRQKSVVVETEHPKPAQYKITYRAEAILCLAVAKKVQQTVVATIPVPCSANMESVETSAEVNGICLSVLQSITPTLTLAIESSHPSALQSKPSDAGFTPHDEWDVTIIWHNMYAPSDFITFRKQSRGPIERILVDFAKVLESGIFEEVYSVSASKHMFCATVVCMKNKDEGVMEQIHSVY